MIDRHFVSSVVLGLIAGTLGTVLYVAGRRRLWRFRGRPLATISLDLALTFGASALVLVVVLVADAFLARVRAGYNPQILVLSMFVPIGIARVIAERRARRERRLLYRDLQ